MKIRSAILIIVALLSVGTPSWALGKNGEFIIVLDAGHGGKDPGAVNGKNQEKTINLNVTLKVGKLIEQNCSNVKVIYTRKTDVFVELYKRADIANKAGADMFVSVHTNAATSKSAKGAETYLLGVEENRTSANFNVAAAENKAILLESDYEAHYEGYDPNVAESQIIFEFMQNEYQKESLKMASMVQDGMIKGAKRPDRGVHQAGYLVLWKSAMPSILIELGFISNAEECKYLVSTAGQDELSKHIAKSICSYIEEYQAQAKKIDTQKKESIAQEPAASKSTAPSTSTAKPAASNTSAAKPASGASSKSTASSATTTKSTASEKVSTTIDTTRPVYKVQFMTTKNKLASNDKAIQGYSSVSFEQENNLYKYFCGDTNSYDEAVKTRDNVRKKYPDAFIVAVLNGKRISVQEARKL